MPVKGILRTIMLAIMVLGLISACVPAVVTLLSGGASGRFTAASTKRMVDVPVVEASLSLDTRGTKPGELVLPPLYGPSARREIEAKAEAEFEASKAPSLPSAEPQPGASGYPASSVPPLPAQNQILAFYGKPGATRMGILGEYTKEQIAPLLEGYGRLYDKANGEMGVIPAFYIIFGTCWPEGEIGRLSSKIIEEYIIFAAEKGWLVFLDHQIGRYTVEDSIKSMFPYLKYPNVHLALDPEWRTLKPMKEIGSISAAELNNAQKLMEEYLESENLPGVRMLVVHQFKPKMILNRETVRADFERVTVVHTSDGFGAPPLKRSAYRYNAEATNMPVKGFKLFFETKVIGAGSDKPLMTPDEVMLLKPLPTVIMYQ